MRRRAERALEQTRQPEPVDPGEAGQLVEAGIAVHLRMQQIAHPCDRGRHGAAFRHARATQFATEPHQQPVECLVAREFAFVAVDREKRLADRADQAAIVDERMAEGRLDATQARQVQTSRRMLDPRLRQIQHPVREAARFGRMAVVQRARLDQDRAARHARMQRPVALETLHALFGEADQHVVVIVRIVRMAVEMRMQAFDAGFRIAPRDEPVVGRVGRFLHSSLSTACSSRAYCAGGRPTCRVNATLKVLAEL